LHRFVTLFEIWLTSEYWHCLSLQLSLCIGVKHCVLYVFIQFLTVSLVNFVSLVVNTVIMFNLMWCSWQLYEIWHWYWL